jgi:antitoxin (DNA-binding transcriptional repressor) of toxin-antitoxin stability system
VTSRKWAFPSGSESAIATALRAGGMTGGALRENTGDARMHHMKRASVRDLRYRFREVEELLREGEAIEITKRKRVIARLVGTPPATPGRRPDFLARLKRIYGNKRLKVTGAKLVAEERGRW